MKKTLLLAVVFLCCGSLVAADIGGVTTYENKSNFRTDGYEDGDLDEYTVDDTYGTVTATNSKSYNGSWSALVNTTDSASANNAELIYNTSNGKKPEMLQVITSVGGYGSQFDLPIGRVTYESNGSIVLFSQEGDRDADFAGSGGNYFKTPNEWNNLTYTGIDWEENKAAKFIINGEVVDTNVSFSNNASSIDTVRITATDYNNPWIYTDEVTTLEKSTPPNITDINSTPVYWSQRSNISFNASVKANDVKVDSVWAKMVKDGQTVKEYTKMVNRTATRRYGLSDFYTVPSDGVYTLKIKANNTEGSYNISSTTQEVPDVGNVSLKGGRLGDKYRYHDDVEVYVNTTYVDAMEVNITRPDNVLSVDRAAMTNHSVYPGGVTEWRYVHDTGSTAEVYGEWTTTVQQGSRPHANSSSVFNLLEYWVITDHVAVAEQSRYTEKVVSYGREGQGDQYITDDRDRSIVFGRNSYAKTAVDTVIDRSVSFLRSVYNRIVTYLTTDSPPIIHSVTLQVSNAKYNEADLVLFVNVTDPDGNDDLASVSFDGASTSVSGSPQVVKLDIGDGFDQSGTVTATDSIGASTGYGIDFDVSSPRFEQFGYSNLSSQQARLYPVVTNEHGVNPLQVNATPETFGGDLSFNRKDSVYSATLPSMSSFTANLSVSGDVFDESTRWRQDLEEYHTEDRQYARKELNISTPMHGVWSTVETGATTSPSGFSPCDFECGTHNISFTDNYTDLREWRDTGDIITESLKTIDINNTADQYYEEVEYLNTSGPFPIRDITVNWTINDNRTTWGQFVDVAVFGNLSAQTEWAHLDVGRTDTCNTMDAVLNSTTAHNLTWKVCSKDRDDDRSIDYFKAVIPEFSTYRFRFGGETGTPPEQKPPLDEGDIGCDPDLDGVVERTIPDGYTCQRNQVVAAPVGAVVGVPAQQPAAYILAIGLIVLLFVGIFMYLRVREDREQANNENRQRTNRQVAQ